MSVTTPVRRSTAESVFSTVSVNWAFLMILRWASTTGAGKFPPAGPATAVAAEGCDAAGGALVAAGAFVGRTAAGAAVGGTALGGGTGVGAGAHAAITTASASSN